MARSYTTTQLLTSVKNRAMIPTSQLTLQDTDILDLATEELWLGVVPFMMKQRSSYFVTYSDTTIQANVDTYAIPSRALGGKLEGLALVDSSGNIFDVPQIEKDERRFFNATGGQINSFSFYFESNNVVIVPKPTSAPSASLRFSFYTRPGDLVATSAAGQIASIDTNANTVTISGTSLPSTFIIGATVDFINGSPGFESRSVDNAITNVSGQVLTFASLPTTLAVNDWVSVAGESPLPQVPPEVHPMLAQRTALKVLEALGDQQAIQNAQGKLKEMEDAATHLLSPRSDQNPKKLINRYSLLRSVYRGFRG